MSASSPTELSIPYVTPAEAYAASILLPLVGIIHVFLRMYTRIVQRTTIGFDDWLMMPALVCSNQLQLSSLFDMEISAT